jgi:hypothetical protein
MKITDPSLWPAGFGPLRFERLREDPWCEDVFQLWASGAPVAELAPLSERDGGVALDEEESCVIPATGCWSLDLIADDRGLIDTRVLCPAPQTMLDPQRLTGELAAWASLLVLWANNAAIVKRG